MLQHGFGSNGGQDFAGETGRLESGRNDAENFTRHRRSYHKSGVLDSGKKGKLFTMLPWLQKRLQKLLQKRFHRLLNSSAIAILTAVTCWGQANIETRPRPGAKVDA